MAQVVLFYYPCIDGRETRPSEPSYYDDGYNNRIGNKRSLSQLNNDNPDSIDVVGSSDDEYLDEFNFYDNKYRSNASINKPNNPVDDSYDFQVFWAERLIPSTIFKNMYFMPNELKTKLRCDKENISYKWKYRVKGLIFLEPTFERISNNKLRLLVESNYFSSENKSLTDKIRSEPKNINVKS